MTSDIVLASGSEIRATLLRRAGVDVRIAVPRVDEDAIRASLLQEGAPPRDIAAVLAEAKAVKISSRYPEAYVIGADQVLAHRNNLLSKPKTPQEAVEQLYSLRGQTHRLLTAAIIANAGKPIWRHVSEVRLVMAERSDAYLQDYVARNWDSIRQAVGAYKLEEEGARLFSRVEGDYFAVLGLPLLEILDYLSSRSLLPS